MQPVTWQTAGVAMTTSGSSSAERLSADERRQHLLDVTMAMVVDDGPTAVSMGAVADAAGVTRALVYKHFENKDALLVELYRREAAALDTAIRERVAEADDGFEPKLRAFIGASLDAVGAEGQIFTLLRGARDDGTARRDQRRWDRRTVGYFVDLAVRDLGVPEEEARSAIGVLFTGIQALLFQLRRSPGDDRRRFLEDTYVAVTLGALDRLAGR